MKCPYCNTEMEIIGLCTDRDGELIALEASYYKCPKCKIEIDAEGDEDE